MISQRVIRNTLFTRNLACQIDGDYPVPRRGNSAPLEPTCFQNRDLEWGPRSGNNGQQMRGSTEKRDDAPKTWKERIAALRNVPPLLKMVWETNRPLCLCTLLLRLVAAFIPISSLWISRLIIDLVVRAIRHQEVDTTRLWKLVALDLALAVLSECLTRLIALVDSLLGDQFTNRISVQIMEHATLLDLSAFEDPVFYDKMERARRQATGRLGMVASLAGIARQFLTLLSMISAVILVSPWLLVLLVAATIPVFIGETKYAFLGYSLLFRQTPEKRELDYIRFLGASNHSAKEVKIFGLGRYLTNRVSTLFTRFYAENRKLSIQRTIHGVLISLVSTGAYYAAYVFILLQALAGKITIGDLTLLTRAFSRANDLMGNIVSQLADVSEQALYTKDLFDFLETRPKIASRPGATKAPRPIRTGFEFQGVSFAYEGAKRPVFEGLNFRIGREERIALVGDNGAGKTTLVKLLARLYDPTAGRILLDGVDLRDYDVEDLRREIGVIFQDYMRYDMLVSENIGVGWIDELANTKRIKAAAEKSLAAPLIDKLPGRLDQMLGRRFEGGTDLSTGQWQKISLARAYMRDAQLLILDEPTASLDARAEFDVYQRFLDLTRGKMAVLISHRFSTVRLADRILVLEHGKIIEEGSHERLVAQRGKYAELFELQAAGYR
jgi:ATP-binding cassette subfamily B protein